ncbi:MAG: type I glyceraldehyde-3-phosphate dehydrogenase [Chloroflexi bacterium RBG_16_68_14]|nr:MAG: type I glyceraldehyde-3-phosphate dehydrogenase [Chloroflexi bacterium RBG_16_68_14]
MATKVGINGFGRIGRQVFKAIRDRHGDKLEVVAVNDLMDGRTNAHLLKYDSNYGRFNGTVEAGDGAIIVDGRPISTFAERDPGAIPWGSVGAEIVVESPGLFTDAEKARAHLHDGVRKVIISAPAKNEDKTIVLGVNDDEYDPSRHHVISNASCTTNGLAPVVKVLLDSFGIVKGQMTTVHAYTNTQRVLDVAHDDLREARAAALNIVPFTTGAARALKLVIPEIEGKLDGLAYRVPTPTVSIVEVVCLTKEDTTAEKVNAAMREAASERMKGILDVVDEHVVSMDMKGDEHSSIVHAPVTNVVGGNLVNVAAWYDNEWGYACRMADLCALLAEKGW